MTHSITLEMRLSRHLSRVIESFHHLWVFPFFFLLCCHSLFRVVLLGLDSLDESLEEPLTLPSPPLSTSK